MLGSPAQMRQHRFWHAGINAMALGGTPGTACWRDRPRRRKTS
ncbi:hypothetical protein PFLCHA0_c49030 [Pseudomonas protegens CHA0]|uniref:Uncharacterized protein n=1 Tax=Pseudomonas protegens (strain DSM 19095 / LMG 27888 / CFBP 6595 / CHA0) TaxID=1124983 RepID=A0A2C9ESL4_PSEPH|nr:hypothetical protein PFLCHA0_c49030 [Pseudomonas protegens CHA0]